MISVIIPIYNAERYFARCLDSVIIQTYKNFEIILINDGSTDNSSKICDEYSRKYENIKVIHSENMGQANARNIGLDRVNGEYIIFIDADDRLAEDALERMMHIAKENDYDIVCCNYYNVFDVKEEINKNNFSDGVVDRYGNKSEVYRYNKFKVSANFGYVWGKLYKTEFISNNEIKFSTRRQIFMEDALFNLKAFSYKPKYYVTNHPIYYYYIREESTSHKSANITYSAINLIDDYNYFLDNSNSYADNMDLYIPLCGRVFCWMMYKKLFTEDNSVKSISESAKIFMEQSSVLKIVTNKRLYRVLCTIPYVQRIMYSFCFTLGRHKQYRLIGLMFRLALPLFNIYVKLVLGKR